MKTIKNHFFVLLFICSALAVVVVAIFSGKTMTDSATLLADSSKNELVALSRAASLMVTAEDLIDFVEPEDMAREEYLSLKARLIGFTEESGLAYTYYLRYLPETGMIRFIIDNTPVDFTALNIPPMDTEPSVDLALSGMANAVEIGSYSDGWEGYMTAFAPVYYSDGTLSEFVAGVDKLDVNIKKEYDSFRIFSALLIVSILIVFVVGIVSVILYQRKATLSNAASISKSTFLANMSHEMRTPMNAIIGMAEIAKKSDDPAQIQYCLDKIDGAALHLLGIINDVLDISKIEAGKLTLSDSAFQVRKMVQNVVNVVSFRVEERQQELIVTIDDDVPIGLIADEQHLSQVITNLLANAIKFTPEKGRITLAVEARYVIQGECELRFTVQDTGIGISQEQQARLFHSFEQADDSISRKFGGTGLGLAISKQIVDRMGGEIHVESELGNGSRFYFTIRALVDPEAVGEEAVAVKVGIDQTAQGESRKPGVYAGKTMLLAEDIEINREILITLLEETGIRVESAENGVLACEMFEAHQDRYDIILMDIQMPEMDGYTATKTIRALGTQEALRVPIIAMTANVFKEDIDRSLISGMNGHLGKPIVVGDLMRMLDAYLLGVKTE